MPVARRYSVAVGFVDCVRTIAGDASLPNGAMGNRHMIAIAAKVIRSELRVAVVSAAYPVAAMATHVQKGVNLALRVSGKKHGVFAHIGSNEIVGLRNLTLMAYEKPAAPEDLLKLLLIDLRIRKDTTVDL